MFDGPQRASRRVAARSSVGIIGWNYPEWKGLVYHEKAKPDEFLKLYAQAFPIVEAASSYYGMPKTETVEKWAADTPKEFRLSSKVPDWILKKKVDDPDLPNVLGVFLRHMQPLADAKKLGTLVAQFGPHFRREKKADELAAFVKLLPAGPRWAVELRHDSWWTEDTYETLRAANVTLVWSAWDGINRTPPVETTDRLYLRIFGDRELPEPYATKRRDGRAELAHWAAAVKAAKAREADIMVSKYLEGYAPGTAVTMCELLGIPPPDLRPRAATAAAGPKQMTFDV